MNSTGFDFCWTAPNSTATDTGEFQLASQQPGFPERMRCRSAENPAVIPVVSELEVQHRTLDLHDCCSLNPLAPCSSLPRDSWTLPGQGALAELAVP